MNFYNNIYALILIFGLSFTAVTCLKCHVCTSNTPGEEDCDTLVPTSTKYLTNCTPPMDVTCRTQEQWVDFEVLKQQSEKRIIRQCASTEFDPDRACYYRTGFGGRVNVCNCLGDGCNEASRTASTILLTLALIFLARLIS